MISEAYKKLAIFSGSSVDKFGHMYSRSGQSEIFLSTQ